MKKILIFLAIIVVVALVAAFYYFKYVCYPLDKDGMVNKYLVYFDDEFFQTDSTDNMYEPGETIEVKFLMNVSDVNYVFDVVGPKEFHTYYDPDTGYTVKFVMPSKPVSVYYYVDEPFDGISISMDENPTTGFEWVYEVEPEGIIQMVEDRYVSDTSDEPVCGLGGMHYWKFKVVGEGTVEIKFKCLRGDEEAYNSETIYKYECDGTSAKLISE